MLAWRTLVGNWRLWRPALHPTTDPPPHVHADEEEVFYVLEGIVEVMCGDQQFTAGPGSLVLTPRGTLHTFHVSDDGPGKRLVITAPARFERFVAEVGSPSETMTLPARISRHLPVRDALGPAPGSPTVTAGWLVERSDDGRPLTRRHCLGRGCGSGLRAQDDSPRTLGARVARPG